MGAYDPEHDDGTLDEDRGIEVVEEPMPALEQPDGRGRSRWLLAGLLVGGVVLVIVLTKVFAALMGGGDEPGQVADDPAPTVQEDTSSAATTAGEQEDQVCVDVANLRAGPSTETEVLGSLVRGTEVLTVDAGDGWVRLVGSETYLSTTTLCG